MERANFKEKLKQIRFDKLASLVMSCDWLVEGQQLVTASWDHTAKLWDFESGQVIHSLEGESTTSWFPVSHYHPGGIVPVPPFVYSILSSLPFNYSLPSYLCSPFFLFLISPFSSLTLFKPWPRAHPCLYTPHTATGGHLLTRNHLQASVPWCRCTVPLSV